MTHTPGPWLSQGRAIIARGQLVVCNGLANPADINLIEAAPDLLAALQDLIAWSDNCGWDNTGEAQEFAAARAAIAKATGES